MKQGLAALRTLFDWLVVGQVMPVNPAASVRGPRYALKNGKTPVLSAEEVRALIDSIEADTIIGLRHRALIGLMFYTFARVGAAVLMRQADVCRMICRRVEAADIGTHIGRHSFRATGITEYLKNGGRLEIAQQMANHESSRATGCLASLRPQAQRAVSEVLDSSTGRSVSFVVRGSRRRGDPGNEVGSGSDRCVNAG